jgi:hypothetical protein
MIMIPFMEKTWFLWWMLAIVVIVRWFHLLQATDTLESDASASAPQQACSNSGEFSSPNARSLWV